MDHCSKLYWAIVSVTATIETDVRMRTELSMILRWIPVSILLTVPIENMLAFVRSAQIRSTAALSFIDYQYPFHDQSYSITAQILPLRHGEFSTQSWL